MSAPYSPQSSQTGFADDKVIKSAKHDIMQPRIISYHVKPYNIFFLAICIVVGNFGAPQSSFWPYMIALIILAIGYFNLTLCLAEMTSILPFAGGSYGFARVTLGPYFGYLVGCFESMENIFFVSFTALAIGRQFTVIFGTEETMEPLYWLLFYIPAVSIQIAGGPTFWNVATALAVITICSVVLFCVCSAPLMNFDRYVDSSVQAVFPDGFKSFFMMYPSACWVFLGIENLSLACEDSDNAKVSVPRMLIASMSTLILLIFAGMIAESAQFPGAELVGEEDVPFSVGWSRGLGISPRMAYILTVPGTVASAYGFMFAYGRQMLSMARSRLLPLPFAFTYGTHQTPYVSIIAGALVGYVVIACAWKFNQNAVDPLFNCCVLTSFLTYISMFISYMVFSIKFSSLERKFVSPLGLTGAVVGFLIFALGLVAIAFFQEDDYHAILFFAVFTVAITVYYLIVARHSQCYSAEEQSILFVLYVVIANSRRRQHKTHRLAIKPSKIRNSENSMSMMGHLFRNHSKIHPSAVSPNTSEFRNQSSMNKEGSTSEASYRRHLEFSPGHSHSGSNASLDIAASSHRGMLDRAQLSSVKEHYAASLDANDEEKGSKSIRSHLSPPASKRVLQAPSIDEEEPPVAFSLQEFEASMKLYRSFSFFGNRPGLDLHTVPEDSLEVDVKTLTARAQSSSAGCSADGPLSVSSAGSKGSKGPRSRVFSWGAFGMSMDKDAEQDAKEVSVAVETTQRSSQPNSPTHNHEGFSRPVTAAADATADATADTATFSCSNSGHMQPFAAWNVEDHE